MLYGKKISIIVAMDPNGLIGKQNNLPWPRIRADMKWFQDRTENNSVLMGRYTWESIPETKRPLSNRENMVLSTHGNYVANGADVYHDFEFALQEAVGPVVYIIGGREVYRLALPFADTLVISHIGLPFHGDVYFPEYDKSEWMLQGDPLLGMSYVPCEVPGVASTIPICFCEYNRIRAAP